MNSNKTREYGFLAGENQEVYNVVETGDEIRVYIKTAKHGCKCPNCGHESEKMASTYQRKVQDTPIRNKRVTLLITASKYQCQNPECGTKIFCEELANVRRGSNRTVFLDQFILSLSIFLSDYTTSLVLGLLNVKVSHDSVRQLRDKVEFKEVKVRNIGIDDVALRKGREYATAVYDLDTGEMLCLLEGRSKEETVKWLEKNKTVQTVARDRASAYAAAVNEVLPEAVQVADRFHLIQNLIAVLKDIFYSVLPARVTIKDGKVASAKKPGLEGLSYDNSEPVDESGEPIEFDRRIKFCGGKDYKADLGKREQKLGRILLVREMRKEKKTYRECAEAAGVSIPTARNYALMSEEEVQGFSKSFGLCPKPVDSCINIIYKMLADGHKPKTIIEYITVTKKIDVGVAALRTAIQCLRKNNFDNSEKVVLSRSGILKACVTIDPSRMDPEAAENLDAVLDAFPRLRALRGAYRKFHSVIMGDEVRELDRFLEECGDLEGLEGFVNGIKRDITAVKNAISLPINSGIVEGYNNKLKCLKRIVYGRTKLVNLEKRCRLAFWAVTDGFSLKEALS